MAYSRWLSHHGVKGQKWGEKNGPPYPLDRSLSDGHKLIKSDGSPQSKKKYKTSEKTAHKRVTRKVKTIFVSGSSKTQDEASGYYRKELPKDIQKQLDEHMRKGNRIIVGDAPGIDRQVQDYLNSKKYRNVEVYGPGKEVRYTANSKWKTNPVDDPDHEPGSKEWLAKKDIAMTEAADEGLAIVLDEGAKATRKNVQRLSEGGKGVRVYSLNKDGNDTWEDDWDRKWNTSYASKDAKKANDIYKTLSKQEKYFLTAEENSKRYVSREEYGKKGTNAYSLIEQYKDTPVSVIDIWKDDRGGADVSIAVRNDSKYRHKGYASRALENGLKYFYDHPEIEYLIWGVNSQNRPSIELAKKYGFYLYDKRDDGWETYTLDQKKEVKHATAYNRWLSTEYLAHHGVKGQKWGERNGPPYPLDSSISTGSKLIKGDGSPQGKKKYKTSEKTAHKRAERKARAMTNGRPLTEKVRSRTADDIKAIEEAQKYDDQQHRRILNGANFLANAKTLGFKIGRYGSNTDNGLPVKKKDTSKDYDLKTINPGGKSTTLSGTNNCLLCTVAYDMRRRGYNVIARQRAPIELLYDIGDEDLSNMYKHTKTIRDESLRGITNKIKRQKNSRGSISCTWNGSNSGHVVAYEVNDGKVTLYDAQSGTRYDDPSKLFSDAHNFRAVRLDNLTPDYRLIKLAVE